MGQPHQSGPQSPDVSVIVAAYNTEDYIGKAIRSALSQEGVTLEVIVVDDCSTDETRRVVRSVEDSRVRLLCNDTNKGPGASRNRALDAAEGTWIAILDSDDWIAPSRFRTLIDAARTEEVDIVGDNLYYVEDEADDPYTTHFDMSDRSVREPFEVNAEEFVRTNRPGLPGLRLGALQLLIRRKVIERYDIRYNESVDFAEDFQFYVRLLLKKETMLVLPTAYYYRRSRPGSLAARDKVDLLEHDIEASSRFVDHPTVQEKACVRKALEERLELTRDHLTYRKVRKALRESRVDLLIDVVPSLLRIFRFVLRRWFLS
jgi:succinoglycan biosynthesis protein ExoO